MRRHELHWNLTGRPAAIAEPAAGITLRGRSNQHMAVNRRGLPASKLARDCGVYIGDFMEKVDALLAGLSEAEASLPMPGRRREICTAVWAAVQASFEAAWLSPEERTVLLPLLQKVLLPYWQKHCAQDPEMAAWLAEHAQRYLERRDPRSQVITAGTIVQRLLAAIGVVPSLEPELMRTLIPLFAHRMIGDSEYLSDIKSRLGIQLPALAALCAVAEVVMNCEPALRVLRLV
jgi:hypothetical protein